MLKKYLAIITLSALSLMQTVSAAEVKLDDPNKMVRKVSEHTFDRIKKDQPLIVKDQEYLRVIVEEELMPYIDYKYAALRVLGSEVSKVRAITDDAEKAQAIKDIQRFIDVFREYLVATYAGVFTQYTNQHVEGISLLDAKQSELQGILRQQGIDKVSDLLEQKSKLPVQFRGSSSND